MTISLENQKKDDVQSLVASAEIVEVRTSAYLKLCSCDLKASGSYTVD